MAASKPQIISIQYLPEQKFYLALTDTGLVFRAFELKPEGTDWEQITLPDFSKTQPKITKRGLTRKHHERTGK